VRGIPTVRGILIVSLVVLAGAVALASIVQRSAADRGTARYETSKRMLEALLDQETSLRGFALSEDENFLGPYREGELIFRSSVGRARAQVAQDAEAKDVLAASEAAARRWQALSVTALERIRAGEIKQVYARAPMFERKAAMDRFRERNDRYAALSRSRANGLETRAAVLSVLLVVVLGGALALAGWLLARRAAGIQAAERVAERAFQARQRDLNLGLQVTESEKEAQGFLYRHLEQAIPGSEVVVLKRNNSANRLLPGTPLAAGSKLEGAFVATEPRSCLAIRLSQRRSQGADPSGSVLRCELCGRLDSEVTCSPLLVGGEVIGSVLIGHPEPLGERGERALDESVKQAAPVLANLRNLAVAETRAATDGLTGLPNRRAFEEALNRTVAHANQTESPLAAVALDLDHFKQVNDVHGHGTGDLVLAEVGALLARMVRDSDFVARIGGEEFVLLLPGTAGDGAMIICERIRAAIGALEFPTMPGGVTASLGVAVLPEDGTEASSLLRAADRMLYQAKERGRDRVEMSEPAPEALPDGWGAEVA